MCSVSITAGIELPLPDSSLRKIAEYDGAMDAIVCVWMIYVLLEWSWESGEARGASRQWSYAYLCANMCMCECVCQWCNDQREKDSRIRCRRGESGMNEANGTCKGGSTVGQSGKRRERERKDIPIWANSNRKGVGGWTK